MKEMRVFCITLFANLAVKDCLAPACKWAETLCFILVSSRSSLQRQKLFLTYEGKTQILSTYRKLVRWYKLVSYF